MNPQSGLHFDVIVVGGGHAGVEAACAAARMGAKTALITLKLDRISHMPCNPAIGGIGKGHIVFEVSALGGVMPQLCTSSYLQARMLNTRKGPAVQGLRLQIDKHVYSRQSKELLQTYPNLTLIPAMVIAIEHDQLNRITGVKTAEGTTISASSVVITTGTFLNGKIHIGSTNYSAGRQGEQAVPFLSQSLASMGLKLGRLKTGTPPRLLRSSIDFSVMERQEADKLDYLFEFGPHNIHHKHPCHITHTNQTTHDIIKKNLHLSAMYSGNISGIGPRYCPSIEDKIARFPDKQSHHVFVEPESLESEEVYPNGLSTSLPFDVQKQYIRSIKGFEDAAIVRPGYAIEYDFVHPNQLRHTLEVKKAAGLFLAGQINGTTGYEEAAGQGIVAGINACLKALKKEPLILDRNQSYIGVMIDDLVTLGVDEPYRMFTSRAERRLILRQDNVFQRLGDIAFNLNLINKERHSVIKQENDIIETAVNQLKNNKQDNVILQLLRNKSYDLAHVKQEIENDTSLTLTNRAVRSIHAQLLYGPYIEREQREIKRTEQYQSLKIPADLDLNNMPGLSIELRQKIAKTNPETIGGATLIQGMTPAAIGLLIFRIRQHNKQKSLT